MSGGELAAGAVRQGRRAKDWANGEEGCWSSGSSSPTAINFPPVDKGGTLGERTEAVAGRGFRRTGEGLLMFGLCGWNVERDWRETLAGIEGFKRGDGSRGSVVEEGERSRLVFRDSG